MVQFGVLSNIGLLCSDTDCSAQTGADIAEQACPAETAVHCTVCGEWKRAMGLEVECPSEQVAPLGRWNILAIWSKTWSFGVT
jgi:hypothetical protein